jgi:TetR/AcrR family transcriptional regulator, transcriptional repressor for nem operon
MRVSKEKAAEHRQQILSSAARLFREHGIETTGVDSITRGADLTHGAVYSQFGSKQAITIETIRLALDDSKRAWLQAATKRGRRNIFTAVVDSYLSARHRDAPGTGCLVAALGAELSRQSKSIRDAFTEEFKKAWEFLTVLTASDNSATSGDDTLAAFAAMAGALMLARAVTDPCLSDRGLQATANWIEGRARPRRSTRARSAARS